MKRTLSIAALVGGLLIAAPPALAAPAAVKVASTGKAITLSTTTPAAGATTFTFRYTGGKKKGVTSPAIVALGAGADPGAVLAAIRKLKPNSGPEKLLKRFDARLVAGLDEIPAGKGRSVTLALSPGTYLVIDGTSRPSKVIGTPFTVAAPTGPVAALPAGKRVTLSDFMVMAPKRVKAGAAWRVVNTGPSLHFLIAIGIPKGLSDKAAVKALRTNDEKAFGNSPASEVVGLISPGVTNVLRPGLARGRWVVACFYANAKSHGRPHSMLGMETVVHVR